VEKFSILVTPEEIKEEDSKPTLYIGLHVDKKRACLVKTNNDGSEELLDEINIPNKNEESPGTEPTVMMTYWFSYDSSDLCLKYGKGYAMTETTQMSYSFFKDCKTQKEKDETREKNKIFFNSVSKKYVWVYSQPERLGGDIRYIDIEPTFCFAANPLTVNYPPRVMDSSEVTLFDLDMGKQMFSKSLPLACQELFYNIKNCSLDYPLNPVMRLSDAIRYSLNTPGCLLSDKIAEKISEFGDLEETYLRVTLGPETRTAPGIPYVLEIWPKGHMSPVHNHGGACAVIKVLFGRITVNIYNKLPNPNPKKSEPKVINSFDAKEGDITWIGPEWYQTHKLVNRTDDFCATIQCYRYDERDTIHYPGFDYVNTSGKGNSIGAFFPNSDFSFIKLRSQVLEEYSRYLGGEAPASH